MLANFISRHFLPSKPDSVVVIGLGRFGGAVAQSLMRMGHDVMGIDNNEALIQKWAETLTHTVQCDSTNVTVMRQIGVADFNHAIVGIGSDLAASIMTIMVLLELGINDIWVKATSTAHGQIAERIGAHHVVYPEAAMGERVAYLVTGKILDFIEFDDQLAIAKVSAPISMHHHSIAETGIQRIFGLTVVGVKRANEYFQHITPDTLILPTDLLIVSGTSRQIEFFANKTGIGFHPVPAA